VWKKAQLSENTGTTMKRILIAASIAIASFGAHAESDKFWQLSTTVVYSNGTTMAQACRQSVDAGEQAPRKPDSICSHISTAAIERGLPDPTGIVPSHAAAVHVAANTKAKQCEKMAVIESVAASASYSGISMQDVIAHHGSEDAEAIGRGYYWAEQGREPAEIKDLAYSSCMM